MIHASYAAVDFAAMMCAVRFPVPARLAEDREASIVAHEDVLGIEVLYARRRRDAAVQNRPSCNATVLYCLSVGISQVFAAPAARSV